MDDRLPGTLALDQDQVDRTSIRNSDAAENMFHALADPGLVEDEAALASIKVRIRRSLDDPRPSLSLDQIDRFIGELAAQAKADGGRA